MAGRLPDNLISDLPTELTVELVTILAENHHLRIERIVSTGHASPEGFWYDQEEHEWVVVLRGEAMLVFENGESVQTNARRSHFDSRPQEASCGVDNA